MKTIAVYLQRLQRFGTLIELDWGEDDNLWNVVWISGGVRYMASNLELDKALGEVVRKAAQDRLTDHL